MSFVKTNLPTQIFAPFLGATTTFDGSMTSVFYETTPEALQAILPPGLQLRGEPVVELEMNMFTKTNFDVPYNEAALLIAVTDEKNKLPGRYVVAMTLDSDQAVFMGRECRGWPKKVGQADGHYDGADKFTAYCARHGVCFAAYSADTSKPANDPERLAKIVADFNVPCGHGPEGATAIFNYLWPVGVRSVMKPQLNPMWLGAYPTSTPKMGFGEVSLQFSKHDPWASLPVVKVIGATITTGHMTLDASTKEFNTEIDPKAFLPYSWNAWDEPH